MLLEPMTWDTAGWPVARGGDLSRPLPRPATGARRAASRDFADDFAADSVGTRWTFYKPQANYGARTCFGAAGLSLAAQGDGPATSSPLAAIVGGERYGVQVELDPANATEAGLLLFYSATAFCGITVASGSVQVYRNGTSFGPKATVPTGRVHLRIVNDADVPSFYYSIDGREWVLQGSTETSGFNTNVFGGFLSLRPALFAAGKGAARFRDFIYHELP